MDVRGTDLLGKVEELGKRTGTEVTFKTERGKGSHGTLYYGTRRAIVPDRKKELKAGTLRGILRQLGINPKDLS